MATRARAELVAFLPANPAPHEYLTGSGTPFTDPTIQLPIYFHNPPARPYNVIGYVTVGFAPPGNDPRKKALQNAAWCAARHGGQALYMVEPRRYQYMIAAVLKWK
jgi:hypothetical protein